MTSAVPTPGSFDKAQKQRALEQQRSMTQALKDQKYTEALEHARTVLMLDPSNPIVPEFVKLLEEKLSMVDEDEGDSDSQAAGNGAEANDGVGSSDTEGSEEDSEEDSEEEGTDSEAEQSDSGTEEESVGSGDVEVDAIGLDTKNMKITQQQRHLLRASLAKQIQTLQQKEVAKKLIASDPLLG